MGLVSLILPATRIYGRIHSHDFDFDAFEFRDDPKLEPPVQLPTTDWRHYPTGPGNQTWWKPRSAGIPPALPRLFLYLPTPYT